MIKPFFFFFFGFFPRPARQAERAERAEPAAPRRRPDASGRSTASRRTSARIPADWYRGTRLPEGKWFPAGSECSSEPPCISWLRWVNGPTTRCRAMQKEMAAGMGEAPIPRRIPRRTLPALGSTCAKPPSGSDSHVIWCFHSTACGQTTSCEGTGRCWTCLGAGRRSRRALVTRSRRTPRPAAGRPARSAADRG